MKESLKRTLRRSAAEKADWQDRSSAPAGCSC